MQNDETAQAIFQLKLFLVAAKYERHSTFILQSKKIEKSSSSSKGMFAVSSGLSNESVYLIVFCDLYFDFVIEKERNLFKLQYLLVRLCSLFTAFHVCFIAIEFSSSGIFIKCTLHTHTQRKTDTLRTIFASCPSKHAKYFRL